MNDIISRRLKMLGLFLFLLGLVTGLVIMEFKNVRMGLAAHMEGVTNGTFLVVAGFVWNELKYKSKLEKHYGDLPATMCYPRQMNQVFVNLLINAVNAIVDKGTITIKTWYEDHAIRIDVSDTGAGIPRENLIRIFEPFFTTKAVGKGTGLGLSITYEIIQRHRGEITVASEEGRGTTFSIKIPVV